MARRRRSRGAPRRTNARQYPRTARLNRLMREIVADALEQIDDERLDLLTVTAVEVEPDLRHALVFYDSLQGAEGDDEVLEALAESRKRAAGRHRAPGPGQAHARAVLRAPIPRCARAPGWSRCWPRWHPAPSRWWSIRIVYDDPGPAERPDPADG